MNIEYFQYHYPSDLFELLVDTIPLLTKSKLSVIDFFASAGVGEDILGNLRRRINEKGSVSKYYIVRTVLNRLNEKGEAALRERREILKRVTDWDNFSSCYPDNRLTAQAFVVQVQKLVNVKDSFTKMNLEREVERKHRLTEEQSKREEAQRQKKKLADVKKDLFSLFNESNPHKRGKALEGVLNRLFEASGIFICDAFTLVGSQGEGIIEQIDGVVKIDGQLYLVEMKWWNEPLGVDVVAQHLVRLFSRGQAHGIFISNSGYTEPAIVMCKDALQSKVVILCALREFVFLLEQEKPLEDFFKAKIRVAIAEKKPFYEILSSD